jgi:nicotinamide phosphoribosyltransferase
MRGSKIDGVTEGVVFGHQMMCKDLLIDLWNTEFFAKPKAEVIERFVKFLKHTLFDPNPYYKHIADLHDLGYLPIEIKAVPEGMVVPLRTPTMMIYATHPDFFWLPTYLETQISAEFWPSYVYATLAHESRKNVDFYGMKSVGELSFSQWQSHDFAMRGLFGLHASKFAIGHTVSFYGSDTQPAGLAAEQFYGMDMGLGNIADGQEQIMGSVFALEHSTVMAGIEVFMKKDPTISRLDAELEYIKWILTEVRPEGIVSIVMDTYDYFAVISNLHRIKDVIMNRNGKLVCRPDSSPKTPLEIIVGDTESSDPLQKKGTLNILWEQFGGTMSPNGYKLLDSHIGMIYGDSITIKLQKAIFEDMLKTGFASTNSVFGIGSYTYQYNTRDSLGIAMKEVGIEFNGEFLMTSKDPKTDSGTKKSQRGAVAVYEVDGKLTWVDGLTLEESNNFKGNLLTTIFRNSRMVQEVTLTDVRNELTKHRNDWLSKQGL